MKWLLTAQQPFPSPRNAANSGLVAVGGDLSLSRLRMAYRQGIFPWFSSDDSPLLWWSPEPRMVLDFDDFCVPRSLAKVVRQARYEIRSDTATAAVIHACSARNRPGQNGTWITRAMQAAYTAWHEAGEVHSVEAWCDGALVGGLYGVAQGRAFFGESMFALMPDASKVAFVYLVNTLQNAGFAFVDCQQNTEHLARFGAKEISRDDFCNRVAEAVAEPTPPWPVGSWETVPCLIGDRLHVSRKC